MAPEARGLSIFQKLVGLIALVALLIVGGLATYFPLREIGVLRQALFEKGLAYGKLLSEQLESAVAFDDQETAREVTKGLVSEPQFLGLTLVNARNEVVHSIGNRWATPRHDLPEIRLETAGDRMVVYAPVVSIEGPEGALVIELSTARIAAAKRSLAFSTIIAAVCALALGTACAWLIARSFVRRLRNIGQAAGRVANGDLSAVIHDAKGDEIGVLAGSFTQMVAQIRNLMEARHEQARVAKERLEMLVAQRTQALDARTRALTFVLDNVDQGLLSVDMDGRIGPECSAAVERLLGPIPQDRNISTYVAAFAGDRALWFDVCWAQLRDDVLPIELALDQIPRRFCAHGRELEFDYKIVEDGPDRQVVVMITDISARIARERAERDQQELAGLMTRMVADRQGFLDFQTDIEQRLASLGEAPDTDRIAVDVHTIKGSAAVYGIGSIAELCHDIEDRMADGDHESAAPLIHHVSDRWRQIAERVRPLISARVDVVEVSPADIAELLEGLRRNPHNAPLVELVERWSHTPVRIKLERLAEQVRRIGDALGKSPISVSVDVDRSRLRADHWPAFWASLVHVLRNAVDHGLEMPEGRVAAGKSREASIALRGAMEDGALVVEIEDDGRGIDWERLREVAHRAELPCETREALVAAMFQRGLSTRGEASTTSGRGVGLAAAHEACIEAGGDVTVDSRPGLGTRFRFVLPDPESSPVAQRRLA